MISEVIPPGKEFLFFALFSIVCPFRSLSLWSHPSWHPAEPPVWQIGKTSAFIGPFVSSAIIDDSHGNNNTPFGFLFALGLVSSFMLVAVDVRRSREECRVFNVKREEEEEEDR